jgi:phenylacetate-CoA ligase
MNWRKPIIYSLLYLSGSKIPQNLKEIKRVEEFSEGEKKEYQEEKLKKLLLYSSKNVPYYKRVLEEAEVVKNNKVYLENFHKIPILTKEIIRKEKENLFSKEKRKKTYENTSGGSTGEPVRFLQDAYYDDWNIATKLYFNQKLGKDIGESEIKLWGSDRDILEGNLTLKERIINRLYNRKFFNCYDFSEAKIQEFIKLNDLFKPVAYWSYVEAVTELANYILKKNIKTYSPKFIITTIGPLYEENREKIKKAFKTKVYNQYGSREVGWVSIEQKEKCLMDVVFWRQALEVLEERNEMIITSLDNYAMPLIRYETGDLADDCDSLHYSFGNTRLYFKIKSVIGRTLGFFKKADGSLFHTHHLVQQMFFKNWIKKFQIIQKTKKLILIKVVESDKHKKEDLDIIEKDIKKLAGDDFKIEWEFVKKIKPSKSGKYLYTICEAK